MNKLPTNLKHSLKDDGLTDEEKIKIDNDTFDRIIDILIEHQRIRNCWNITLMERLEWAFRKL